MHRKAERQETREREGGRGREGGREGDGRKKKAHEICPFATRGCRGDSWWLWRGARPMNLQVRRAGGSHRRCNLVE